MQGLWQHFEIIAQVTFNLIIILFSLQKIKSKHLKLKDKAKIYVSIQG